MASQTDIAAAMQLASTGQVAAALDRLKNSNEAQAVFAHGLWHFEGRVVPRDVAQARESFARAEAMGSQHAAGCLAALMAAGVGGVQEWQGALALLERWRGRDRMAARQLDLIGKMEIDEVGAPARGYEKEILGETPGIRKYLRFLSVDECDLLIELADARFKRATIFHEAKGRFVEDPVRDSELAGFPILLEAPFVNAINRRIASASQTEFACGEPLQVLRYHPGQQYRLHTDAIAGMRNQRAWTFLIYLDEGYEGGETSFPELDFAFRGQKGDALLFQNADEAGIPLAEMRHAGNPVLSGVKHLASRWIRQRPPDDPLQGFGPQDAAAR
ncbi:MAG: 2OG-Fe(II) oxygenase [Sphingomonadales bacterium]|nr:MAG: 2OG-Fe(II) oxygenase [Sphingomonadales bacterium]